MTFNKTKIKYRTHVIKKLLTDKYFTVFPDVVSCTSAAVVACLVNCSACSTVLTRKFFAGTLEKRNAMSLVLLNFGYLELPVRNLALDRGTQQIVSVEYLFGRPVIASHFRLGKCHLELSYLMPFVFGEIKMTFWAQK